MEGAVKALMHRAEMQQKVDDLCNKDQLHGVFVQLSRGTS